MYAGCSGATYVYACCITDRACICTKICMFASRMRKRDFKSVERNGRPSKKDAWSEEKFVVTDSP
jgi:hypothetical protein